MQEGLNNLKTTILNILPSIEHISLILLKVALLLVVGYYLSRFVAKKIKKTLESKDIVLANFLSQVAFIGLNVAIIIAALGTLGVQTNSIIAVLGTAGVAVALGLKDSLSSVASGIILIILRPFANNDTIELGALTGKVEAINLFNTTIRLPDGKLAIIPNSNISKANVINSTDISKRRLDVVFGVGYGSHVDSIKLIAINVLENSPCVDLERGYFIGLQDLGESSLNFILRFWVDIKFGLLEAKASVLELLLANLEANNIEIPFNKLDVNLKTQEADSEKLAIESGLKGIIFVDSKGEKIDNISESKKPKNTQSRVEQGIESENNSILDKITQKIKFSMKNNGE
ncbi:small-conductance mechanosensitive channel MscS [Helicobacter himalayensis]|uniref:small-conductance mechanosensitive channel MscS n=1 Tax=Helicobacter himalayensis TaxID=1591088 RepID=UPI003D6FB822